MNDSSELVSVGYGNYVPLQRVSTVLSPLPAAVQRFVRQGKDEGMVIDLTAGRRTRAVAIMDSGGIMLLGLTMRELGKRGLPVAGVTAARRRRKRRR